jgi:DNA polymerase III subunit gamma/tau
MLLRAHDEARRAPDPKAAVEMALIRLCYAADLPGPEEALKALRDGDTAVIGGQPTGGGSPAANRPSGSGGGAATARMVAPAQQQAPQALASPQSFEDVLGLIEAKRDVSLKLDVDRFMRPISFRPGAITFEPAPGAPANLAGRLVARLKEWTGQPWLVAAEGGGGAESAWERQKREEKAALDGVAADPFVQTVMAAFPGAEIVGVRKLAPPEAAVVEEEGAESAED